MGITVLIATYNRAALLRTCLAQLSRQAFEAGDEVIVADNGSTDDTAAAVASAAAGFPAPLRYVVEKTPGKSHALTAALAVSRGDIIALTDDDVIVADDWIPVIRSLWHDENSASGGARPLGLVGGRVTPRWERPAPRWLRVQSNDGYGRLAGPLALLDYGPRRTSLGGRTALGANMAVTRRALDAAGGFPLDLGKLRGTLLSGEDHQLCERVQAAGFAAVFEPRLAVQHHVPADRLRPGYYLRWFFWSGITNAAMDRDRGGRPIRSRYWAARISKDAVLSLAAAATLRLPALAEAITATAFSLGYLAYARAWVKPPMQAAGRDTRPLEAA